MKLIFQRFTEEEAYNFGYDCGLNGANTENCDFRIFSCQENMKAWEKGKARGEAEAGNNFKAILSFIKWVIKFKLIDLEVKYLPKRLLVKLHPHLDDEYMHKAHK